MGDYPIEELSGRTLLQAAWIPNIRKISGAGTTRMVQTVPEGTAPGSDVANLSLLGYDPREYYTGRAPIEAAGAGIPLQPDDIAYRCNLVTVSNGAMKDYSAGEITSEEAHQLIHDLDRKAGKDGLKFHGGVSYRHLLVWKNGPVEVKTQPPHDIANQPVDSYLPQGDRQDEIRRLMDFSRHLFAEHPVNRTRIQHGKNPATQIWLWGQGRSLTLKGYQELYGLRGGVISAVDLIRGLGRLAGLKADKIPGATGFVDTNFEGKVRAAMNVLNESDFVFVHVEAPDECGHKGNLKLKKEAIELFDAKVVGPIWQHLESKGEPYRLVICTDHRTPVATRSHTSEPVPLAYLDGPVGLVSREAPFDETVNGGKAEVMAFDLIRELLNRRQ
ncbi:MAG: cofactor-independent phosphoglycerate mutase [Lentisphaerae bacterium GWF2_57_35]|nr:MAG: cofactor-independent phosphoglycerate mutase [Lentisphaerae bacterium GWF2_57_35]